MERLRFPTQPRAKLVLIPNTTWDVRQYFAKTLKRRPREFLPVGILYCKAKGCDKLWQQKARKHGANYLLTRCGIADAAGWETRSIVGTALLGERIPGQTLAAGDYACSGSMYLDLKTIDQAKTTPEFRLLAKVIRAKYGWRHSLNWLRHKYKGRFQPSFFIKNASLVGAVAGPTAEVHFLRQGVSISRGDSTIRKRLQRMQLMIEQRRAVVKEPGNLWVEIVHSISNLSNRPSEETHNLLGRPRFVPSRGNYKHSWTSRSGVKTDHRVVVGIKKAQYIDGLRIVETYLPINVKSVSVKTPKGKWEVLWRGGRTGPRLIGGRVTKIRFSRTDYPVSQVALTVASYPSFSRIEIAAIALHSTK